MSEKIVFIGAGNIATHLSQALKKQSYSVIQVYSRTGQSARQLADKLDTGFTTSVHEISTEADIYVIALKDSAFGNVLSKINFGEKLVLHCSGSMPLSSLERYAENYGVLYPLQTFSKQRHVNFKEIPVFVEANSKNNEERILEITRKISGSATVLNSERRLFLHIAAVFACNFVNHFYTQASEILKTKEIPFEGLKPLILETARKVQEMNPDQAQTGPAVRYDENIIGKHLNALESNPEAFELYNSISKSIFEFHQKNS